MPHAADYDYREDDDCQPFELQDALAAIDAAAIEAEEDELTGTADQWSERRDSFLLGWSAWCLNYDRTENADPFALAGFDAAATANDDGGNRPTPGEGPAAWEAASFPADFVERSTR